jgi:hypothetical protein
VLVGYRCPSGGDGRLPAQYQPRDWRMHLPSSHTMNMCNPHSSQSSINCSSALPPVSSSDQWSSLYGGHLCACASSLSNSIHIMLLLGWSISSPSSQQSHHSICIPPWFSPVSLANSLCLHSFSSLRSCLTSGEIQAGLCLVSKQASHGHPTSAYPNTIAQLSAFFAFLLWPVLSEPKQPPSFVLAMGLPSRVVRPSGEFTGFLS